MKIFLDTVDTTEIAKWADRGMVDGVTTNPSLIARSGRNHIDVLRDICSCVKGPVSAEVIATNTQEIVQEAQALSTIANNIIIKLPITIDGLRACRVLRSKGMKTNVTLCFSANQALLAAKVGATYISPFVGRLDDIGHSGMQLISDIMAIYRNYNFSTEVIVASVRHPDHILEAAKLGAHVVTTAPSILERLYTHPMTEQGLELFLADWKASGQSIDKQ